MTNEAMSTDAIVARGVRRIFANGSAGGLVVRTSDNVAMLRLHLFLATWARWCRVPYSRTVWS